MKAFSLLLIISLFAACSPRDGNPTTDKRKERPKIDLKVGGLSVSGEGQRLPSCNTDEKWSTVRLFAELSFMFDKANALSLVVGNSRNCNVVSKKEVVKIELSKPKGQKGWNQTNFSYHIKKLELRDTSEVLSDQKLLKKLALGMQMSVEQMKTYLSARQRQEQISIVYFKENSLSGDSDSDLEGGAGSDGENENTLPEPVVVSEPGMKLPSCSKDSDPTWKTLRLKNDLSGMFSKIDDLKVVVNRGDFNCLPVSENSSVEVELQQQADSKKYEKSGVYYKVTQVELVSLIEFLLDSQKVQMVASGMGMSVDELEAYLSQNPYPEFLNLTYVERTEEAPSPGTIEIKEFVLPEYQGKAASQCHSFWKNIRLFPETKDLFLESVKNKSLKAFLSPGSRNCFAIGEPAFFTLKETEGGTFVDLPNSKFKVESVLIRSKVDYVKDPALANYVAEDLGMSRDQFLTYLETFVDEQVNVTRIQWFEAQNVQ